MKNDPCADTPPKKKLSGLTRRSWLQSTGWIIAAGAFSRVTAWAAAEISPVMEKLSTYMTEARNRELPEKAQRETGHHILDPVASMVSGSDLPPRPHATNSAQHHA